MTISTEERPPLGVAIVGCGVISYNHARAIARHPQLELVAVVDAIAEAATKLADFCVAEVGVARPSEFASLTPALATGGIDVVIICTPSGTHVRLAAEAVESGAHVVIEKPLDVAVSRARRIAELAAAAEAKGIVVSVISQHRFDPASVVVAGAISSGSFGRITSAVATVPWWRTQDYYDSGQWRGTWELDGGGALMNQGVHTVDLVVWFLGSPVEISAQTALLAHENIEVEDVAVATITFASGALAVIHASTAGYPGLPVRVQVQGSRGSAVIDGDQLDYFHAAQAAASGGRPDQGEAAPANQAAGLVPASDLRGGDKGTDAFVNGHLRQYNDIVEAIRRGSAPGVRVQDALVSLAVVRAIYLSATRGEPILFADVLAGRFDDEPVSTGGADRVATVEGAA
jgi:predicted dehydrogenase